VRAGVIRCRCRCPCPDLQVSCCVIGLVRGPDWVLISPSPSLALPCQGLPCSWRHRPSILILWFQKQVPSLSTLHGVIVRGELEPMSLVNSENPFPSLGSGRQSEAILIYPPWVPDCLRRLTICPAFPIALASRFNVASKRFSPRTLVVLL